MTHDSTAPPLQRILREAIKRRHTRTVKPNVLRGTEKTNVTNIVRETHQKRTGCSCLPLPLSAMEHALAETVLKKNSRMAWATPQCYTRHVKSIPEQHVPEAANNPMVAGNMSHPLQACTGQSNITRYDRARTVELHCYKTSRPDSRTF